jgi:gamma-polyglutamate biosynthesis protein CapC
MVIEALFIGLVLGFIYYELVGVSPGGVIAPGYIALFIKQPNKILMTLIIALIVLSLIQVLSKYLILYGRRKLLIALLLGFCCKLVVELWIQPMSVVTLDLQSIGYIIPGLIANEMSRQKVLPTLLSLGIVSILVYLILLAI